MPSSPTPALSRQPLVGVFKGVPDPRHRRGRRHRLDVVLAVAAVGVLAGCRTLLAIWEHAQDLTGGQLADLGVHDGRGIPSESTICRTLQDLDPGDFDARIASWMLTRTGTIEGRRVIAVERARPCAAPNPRTTTAAQTPMAVTVMVVGRRI